MYRLRRYTLLRGTSYKTVLSPHGPTQIFCTNVYLYSLKRTNFVAACNNDFDTSAVIIALQIFLKMLLVMLQYHLMFLLRGGKKLMFWPCLKFFHRG